MVPVQLHFDPVIGRVVSKGWAETRAISETRELTIPVNFGDQQAHLLQSYVGRIVLESSKS